MLHPAKPMGGSRQVIPPVGPTQLYPPPRTPSPTAAGPHRITAARLDSRAPLAPGLPELFSPAGGATWCVSSSSARTTADRLITSTSPASCTSASRTRPAPGTTRRWRPTSTLPAGPRPGSPAPPPASSSDSSRRTSSASTSRAPPSPAPATAPSVRDSGAASLIRPVGGTGSPRGGREMCAAGASFRGVSVLLYIAAIGVDGSFPGAERASAGGGAGPANFRRQTTDRHPVLPRLIRVRRDGDSGRRRPFGGKVGAGPARSGEGRLTWGSDHFPSAGGRRHVSFAVQAESGVHGRAGVGAG